MKPFRQRNTKALTSVTILPAVRAQLALRAEERGMSIPGLTHELLCKALGMDAKKVAAKSASVS